MSAVEAAVRDMNATLVRSPSALHREIGDETVILHADTGVRFSLNPLGARIWTLLGTGRTPAELCTQLLAELEVSAEVLERDVIAFLEVLDREGLVLVKR